MVRVTKRNHGLHFAARFQCAMNLSYDAFRVGNMLQQGQTGNAVARGRSKRQARRIRHDVDSGHRGHIHIDESRQIQPAPPIHRFTPGPPAGKGGADGFT